MRTSSPLDSLPPLVKDVQQGWSGSCQASAVVVCRQISTPIIIWSTLTTIFSQAALFAGIEASLITLIKTPPAAGSSLRDSNPGWFHFLLLLSYAALCFNAGATITSLVISDQLGEMPFRSRKIKPHEVPGSAHLLLKDYQVTKHWSSLIAYCKLDASLSMIS